MMICALLVFLGMFESHTDAIYHYNSQRARNMKALTISSQLRYVKFFVGFLHKLAAEHGKKEENFFELSFRQYNQLLFNRVFEDMRQ